MGADIHICMVCSSYGKGSEYTVVKNLACFDKTKNSIKSHFTQDALEGFST